jgi:protein-disulfide isomerase
MIRSFLTASSFVLAFNLLALGGNPSKDKFATPTPDTVIASVDGSKITLGELEQKRADYLFQARNNYYESERKVLQGLIDDYLLEKQAQKEGVSVDQLLDKHVKSTMPKEPSEEALHVFYEGVETQEPFEAMRGRILDRIHQVRFDKAKAAYLDTLRSQANIVVSLPAPRADIHLENTPVLGAQNAPVLFVEYADYECPYCQQVAPAIQKLETEYKGKVTFAYKHLPLPMHPHAEKAAEAASCAAEQGKFWDYHNLLFTSKKLEVADLKQDARKLNLDTTAFDKCLDSGKQAPLIKEQQSEAQRLALQGTPSFFINGRFMGGAASYEQLRDAIEQELALAAPQPNQTASR